MGQAPKAVGASWTELWAKQDDHMQYGPKSKNPSQKGHVEGDLFYRPGQAWGLWGLPRQSYVPYKKKNMKSGPKSKTPSQKMSMGGTLLYRPG